MKKTIYSERNRRDVLNIYGEKTGFEFDVFFGDLFIGTITDENSFGPYGSATGLFRGCETTTPITEVAEELNLELVHPNGEPVPKYW